MSPRKLELETEPEHFVLTAEVLAYRIRDALLVYRPARINPETGMPCIMSLDLTTLKPATLHIRATDGRKFEITVQEVGIVSATDKNPPDVYAIWSEGYLANGTDGIPAKARLHGLATGKTFKEACMQLARENATFAAYFDSERMTFWGCKLFADEQDARKAFG